MASRPRKQSPVHAAAPPQRGAALARIFEQAAGYIRRLRAPRGRAPPSQPGDAGRRAQPSAQLRQWQLVRQRIALDAERLEAEIDQLHASMVARSPTPAGPDRSAGRSSALNETLNRARLLRDQLQEKRLELVRLERHIAREQRLADEIAGARGSAAAFGTPRSAPRGDKRGATAWMARTDRDRRHLIVTALREASSRDSTEQVALRRIAQELLGQDPETRRSATVRLGSMATPSIGLLLVAGQDKDERVRQAALNGLVGCKQTVAIDLFRAALRSRSGPLRLAGLRGLAHSGTGLRSAELMAALEDEDPSLRRAAATILGVRRREGTVSREVLSALAFALQDGDETVRIAAAAACGALGHDGAVMSLIRAVADPAPPVQRAVWRALRSILGKPVETVGEGLAPQERAAALRSWWRHARVERRMVGRSARAEVPDVSSYPPEGPFSMPEPTGVDAPGMAPTSVRPTSFEPSGSERLNAEGAGLETEPTDDAAERDAEPMFDDTGMLDLGIEGAAVANSPSRSAEVGERAVQVAATAAAPVSPQVDDAARVPPISPETAAERRTSSQAEKAARDRGDALPAALARPEVPPGASPSNGSQETEAARAGNGGRPAPAGSAQLPLANPPVKGNQPLTAQAEEAVEGEDFESILTEEAQGSEKSPEDFESIFGDPTA
jgi:hypothetical protein